MLLFLPWLPCHFYLVVIKQQQNHNIYSVGCNVLFSSKVDMMYLFVAACLFQDYSACKVPFPRNAPDWPNWASFGQRWNFARISLDRLSQSGISGSYRNGSNIYLEGCVICTKVSTMYRGCSLQEWCFRLSKLKRTHVESQLEIPRGWFVDIRGGRGRGASIGTPLHWINFTCRLTGSRFSIKWGFLKSMVSLSPRNHTTVQEWPLIFPQWCREAASPISQYSEGRKDFLVSEYGAKEGPLCTIFWWDFRQHFTVHFAPYWKKKQRA